MTFIPGKDLGLVYSSLSKYEKKDIAKRLINYQKEIKKLPMASGFGSLNSYEDTENLFTTWEENVLNDIKRAEEYLKEEMNLNPSQGNALQLYILIFCIIFMSEKGARFNQNEPIPVTEQEKNRLINIFENYYEELKIFTDELSKTRLY